MKITPLQKTDSLTNKLADSIRDEILLGKYQVGDKLPSSKSIEMQAGVSRTVVREALAQLRAEGILESKQGSGVFVCNAKQLANSFDIDPTEFDDIKNAIHILELRMAVEVAMSGKAAEHRTAQQLAHIHHCYEAMADKMRAGESAIEEDFAFHKAIADSSTNPYFRRFIDFIGKGVIPSREIITNYDQMIEKSEFLEIVQAEHLAILNAIEAKDPQQAKTAAHAHLSNSILRHKKIEANLKKRAING